ncbi:MAG: tetratricopeptide repeat protein [Wolinella sp.]
MNLSTLVNQMARWSILAVILFVLAVEAREPSAFGGQSAQVGNVTSSSNPNASSVRAINAKNKTQAIDEIKEKLFELDRSLKGLEEAQEGLKSVIEGQNRKIQSLSTRQNSSQNSSNEKGGGFLTQKELQAILEENNKGVSANFALHDENFKSLRESIHALGELIEQLNRRTKSDIEAIRSEIEELCSKKGDKNPTSKASASKNTAKKVASTPNTPTAPATPSKPKFSKENSHNIYKEAANLFEKGKLAEAKERLEWTVKNQYKPASSNYLLGEIAFSQRRYKDAIYYYKESATLFDKAPYMPKLLLHSSKSLAHTGDKGNAKRFLETLIANYPNSPEAKEAKKLLK